jgi:hypothetical protein
MSDFEEALRGTMSQKNSAFEMADWDLQAETKFTSAGIENLTNKRASLELETSQEADDGVWYTLRLTFRAGAPMPAPDQKGADGIKSYQLGTFFIPWKGYPIRTGHGQQLPNRASIAAYFVEMARNPTSPLVNYIAFNLRRLEQAVAGS